MVTGDHDRPCRRRHAVGLLCVVGTAATTGCLRLVTGGGASSDDAGSNESGVTTGDASQDTASDESGATTDDSSQTAEFVDDFADGVFTDRWEYISGQQAEGNEIRESGTTLRHIGAANYGPNSPIRTRRTFRADGTVRVEARIQTREASYNGFGFSIRGEDAGFALKNHKWEGYDRFAVFGVTDRPDRYESDYNAYGEQINKAKLAPGTLDTSFIKYTLTVDFNTQTVTRVSRGDETWDLALSVRDIGDSYHLSLPAGGGHDVEYDAIAVGPADGDWSL